MTTDELLKCPYCEEMILDSCFESHLVGHWPAFQGRVRGSYMRWLDAVRVGAGGRPAGGGEGRGLFSV